MTDELKRLHDMAVAHYNAGCRDISCILNREGFDMLDSFGVSAQFLYDAVDDLARYGEPDCGVFIELAEMRAVYFKNNLQSRPALRIVEERELPPKVAEFDGVAWLPRIVAKARCFLEGSLCSEIMYGCAGDRAFLKKFKSTLPAFLKLACDCCWDEARILSGLRQSSL